MFIRDHIIVGKTTLYDMEVSFGDRQVVTACQDRNIRVYDVSTGKQSKSYKGSYAEEGSLIKVSLDPINYYTNPFLFLTQKNSLNELAVCSFIFRLVIL
jgi:mitogen-activated protein kinase binding protein 1